MPSLERMIPLPTGFTCFFCQCLCAWNCFVICDSRSVLLTPGLPRRPSIVAINVRRKQTHEVNELRLVSERTPACTTRPPGSILRHQKFHQVKGVDHVT